MSAAEVLVRLLVALLCWLASTAVILPALGDRRGLATVAVLVAIGGVAVGVAITWPRRDGEDR